MTSVRGMPATIHVLFIMYLPSGMIDWTILFRCCTGSLSSTMSCCGWVGEKGEGYAA